MCCTHSVVGECLRMSMCTFCKNMAYYFDLFSTLMSWAEYNTFYCCSCTVGPLALPLCTSTVCTSVATGTSAMLLCTMCTILQTDSSNWYWDTVYSLDQTPADIWNENSPRKLKPDGEAGDSQCHTDTATQQYCLFIALIHKIWTVDEQSHDAIIVTHVLYPVLYLFLAVDDSPVPLPLDTQAYCEFHFITQIFWTKMKWFFHIAFFRTCLEALSLS